MKRMIRRALLCSMLAIGTAAAFTLAGGVTVSFAAAAHPVSTYGELASAISDADPGDTIEITADIVVNAELTVGTTLTINGNGHTISVPVPGLDDSGTLNSSPSAFRVFNLTSGTLAIHNATIKGGAATGAGSGIYVQAGATLQLSGVTISNSGGSGYAGGGIANNGTAYLDHCNVIRNGAAYGGGFLNVSGAVMFVEGCSFSENRSLDYAGGGGAGENQSGAYLYVNNSTFSNNISTELGGAINNYYGTAYILNSTFTGNVNYYYTGTGGALRLDGDACLINSIFAYNYSSDDGGASYSLNDFDDSPTAASHCIFHGSAMAGNVQYAGAADGADDTLFTGGSTSKVLAADGAVMGTDTVYQPYLAGIAGSATASVPLRPGSAALYTGTKTGFTNGGGSPVVGYVDTGVWVTLAGSDAASFEVTCDQNGSARAATPAKGAVETTVAQLYMIKVNSAAGGTVSGGTIYGDTYSAGSSVTLTAIPSDGYKFSRWADVTDSGTLSTATPYTFTISKSLTIAPVFETLASGEYVVTYVGNENTGGTVPASGTHTAPAAISDNTGHLAKTGFAFSGWNTRANGSGTGYAAGDTYSLGSNLTLYAQWERGYTVTFDSRGGGSVPSATVAGGSTVAEPDSPARPGWNFAGWYREAACTNMWNFGADTVAGDITLYAKWTAIPIAFHGGALPEGTRNAAYSATVGAAGGSGSFIYELVSGALPAGLGLSANGGITGTPAAAGNNSLTIQATDTVNGEAAMAAFTLRIASPGTVAAPYATPAPGRIDYGEAVTLSVTTPGASIYYTLNGDTPTAASAPYTGAIPLYADTTIRAVAVKAGWDQSGVAALAYTIKTYTVSYRANGASGGGVPVDSTAYRKGAAARVRDNAGALTKNGYMFGGWNTKADKSGKHYDPDNSFTVHKDTVLYAEWSISRCTVAFKDWDGAVLKTQEVEYGGDATAPPEPERAGYAFAGWDASYKHIVGNTVVTAKYVMNEHSVTFDTNGGSEIFGQSVLDGQTVKIPQDPQKDGCSFDAWYADSALTVPYRFDSAVTQDMTLYAGWIENPKTAQQTEASGPWVWILLCAAGLILLLALTVVLAIQRKRGRAR